MELCSGAVYAVVQRSEVMQWCRDIHFTSTSFVSGQVWNRVKYYCAAVVSIIIIIIIYGADQKFVRNNKIFVCY